MGRFEESLEYLDKALNTDPKSISALINKAESLRQLNRLDEALEIILDIDKQNVRAFNIAIRIFYEQAKYSKAAKLPKLVMHYKH